LAWYLHCKVYSFARFGGEQFIGLVVALGVIRELGPLMTGLMVTGEPFLPCC